MGRRRGPAPCAKYLVGEGGDLCPICGRKYLEPLAGGHPYDGCGHTLADLKNHAAKPQNGTGR